MSEKVTCCPPRRPRLVFQSSAGAGEAALSACFTAGVQGWCCLCLQALPSLRFPRGTGLPLRKKGGSSPWLPALVLGPELPVASVGRTQLWPLGLLCNRRGGPVQAADL